MLFDANLLRCNNQQQLGSGQWIVEVYFTDLFDAGHPGAYGVPVNPQFFGCVTDMSTVLGESNKGGGELCVVGVIVVEKTVVGVAGSAFEDATEFGIV